MDYFISKEDLKFKIQVETFEFPVPEFDHHAHLRLAYIYIVQRGAPEAVQLVRDALIGLLKYAGIDPTQKYHETLTEAWILAVYHFMHCSNGAKSANEFIENNPALLDSKIMMTHYSEDVLFSDQARELFVKPNLAEIPRHVL